MYNLSIELTKRYNKKREFSFFTLTKDVYEMCEEIEIFSINQKKRELKILVPHEIKFNIIDYRVNKEGRIMCIFNHMNYE